jgi:putative Holliday junction resolvase
MRILGVDPGGKRLGLAVGDDHAGIATPLAVIRYLDRDRAVSAIADAIETHGVSMIVIGLPTNSKGEETPACARSHALASALETLGVEVSLQAEHLTTDEARRRARSMGRRADKPVDDLAAQIILEDFLARIAADGRS